MLYLKSCIETTVGNLEIFIPLAVSLEGLVEPGPVTAPLLSVRILELSP